MPATLRVMREQLTNHRASYWHVMPDGRIQCDVCPRHCRLKEGQKGACFVRQREGDHLVLSTYGLSTGFCIDPIEKKPLYHFYPGTPVLSFGTAGCNLTCDYCQNWGISHCRQVERLLSRMSPQQIAQKAAEHNCRSVAFTYNEPTVFLEYAADTARCCRDAGVRTVAVTAGWLCGEARRELFANMDAANVDLKAFSETFYSRHCGADLKHVLDTLLYLKHETEVWLEITTLLIPGENDREDEIRSMAQWLVSHLGETVPLHFTAFHPDYKLKHVPPTSLDSLRRAACMAREEGLKHVYTGNVCDVDGGTTFCSVCGKPLIVRDRYELLTWNLDHRGCCQSCGHQCEGFFDKKQGLWGNCCQPLSI